MDKIHTGIVTNFFIDKNYGFVKDIDGSVSYFFLLDKKEQIALSKQNKNPIAFIRKGDTLQFKIKKSERKPGEFQAHKLEFVKNENLELIKTSISNGLSRFGVIIEYKGKIYLSDTEFDISFPVKILHKEKHNLNYILTLKRVEYFLEQRKNPTKIYAKLRIK